MTSRALITAASVITIATLGLAGCGTSNSTNNTATSSSATQNTTSNTVSGDAKTVTKTTSKSPVASANATLISTKGSKVKGTASLTLDSKTHQLTVVVKATGFVPNSVHPEHIHSGTTAKTGPVVYALGNLIANKSGDATATTVIKGVKSIPTSGWVINIHQSTKDLTVLSSGDVK